MTGQCLVLLRQLFSLIYSEVQPRPLGMMNTTSLQKFCKDFSNYVFE